MTDDNKRMTPRVICAASDKYLPALRIYAHLLNKYWNPNPRVVVAGFSFPDFDLPDNFEFVSIGKQEDYPFQKWSNAICKFLNEIEDEAFVLMLEDYFITRPVNTPAVRILYDYMLQFEYVIKIDLCADRLYAHGADLNYGNVAYIDLIKSMPGSPYHMSLMTGLWRRKHLLRHLIPDESPHDVELIGTTRLSHDQDVIVLGTRLWPIKHTLGLRAGNAYELNLSELSANDVIELRELGYLRPWEEQ